MKLWGSVRQGAAKVAFEADKMVRVRKQESAIGDIEKQVQAQYAALGEKVIGLFRSGMIDHPEVAGTEQQVASLEATIVELQAELERIKAEEYVPEEQPEESGYVTPGATPMAPAPAQPIAPIAPAASSLSPEPAASISPAPAAMSSSLEPEAQSTAAGEAKCPNCGATVSPSGSFCPECGQALK